MKIAEILAPEAVKIVAGCGSKKRLFQNAADLAAARLALDPARVSAALMEREALGSTGVGHGVALPHARLAELDEVHGLFLRLDKPIDFRAPDRQGVDLVFVLLAPLNAGVEHLKALALVSRVFRHDALCDKLRANEDPAALFALLTDDLASKAA